MEQLPVYITLTFLIISLLTLVFFWSASGYSRKVILLITAWLILQLIISISGFYTITDFTPPRFLLLVLPPVLLIAIMFITKNGRRFIDGLDLNKLTLLHVVRVPVEIILLMLYVRHYVPQEMTFEGRNFDILSGITAPLVYYGITRNFLSNKMLLAWNIVCMILLINIVSTGVLSTPYPFQQFGFDQPNIAVLYFPFTWLPGFIVPIVFFSHLVAVKRLTRKGGNPI